MKRLSKLVGIVPKYAWLPMIVALAINHAAYFVTRIFTTSREHYYLELPIDSQIPVVPAFVTVYFGAYLFWILGYCTIARGGEQLCLEVLAGDMVAKLICFVIFMVFPTAVARPEITGTDGFSEALRMLYDMDPADNLFPSIHCLESWACFRGVARRKDCSAGFRWGCLLAAVVIFLSTLFVRQHMVLDVFGGVAVFEAGYLISRLLRVHRLLDKLNHRFRLTKGQPEEKGAEAYGRITTE